MTPRSGEELTELEARQEPRLVKALEMVAPGTAVREGIDNIVHARTGGLLVIGDPDDPLLGDRYAPSHRRARLQADRRPRHRRLPAPRRGVAVRRRREVHPRGD